MLDFKGISVHYGHQDVLNDVTFRVNKGDRIGVVGPNGSGKSTLFRITVLVGSLGGLCCLSDELDIGMRSQNSAHSCVGTSAILTEG